MNRRLFIHVILIGLIGFGITWFLCFEIDKIEKEKFEMSFYAAAKDNYKRISHNISQSFIVIQALRQYFYTNSSVSKKSFDEFCQPFLDNLSGIKALSWNPIVYDEKKDGFIKENKESVLENFDIKEKNSEGKMVSSDKRPFYIPVQFITPLNENKPALGFDIASDKIRFQTIEESVKSNSIKITSIINLVQDFKKTNGFLAVCPILKDKEKLSIDNLKGVVVGVYNVQKLIVSNGSQSDLEKINIKIFDATEKKHKKKIYDDSGSNEGVSTDKDGLVFIEKIIFGGRKWKVYITPGQTYKSLSFNNKSIFVIIFGSLITMLSMFFYSRNYLSQKEILRNADSLKKANEEKGILLKEIHHRVKNNLQVIKSLLNLQTNKIKDQRIVEELNSSKLRINSMALVHELLFNSNEFSKISFDNYIDQLLKVLVHSYKGRDHNIILEVDIPRNLYLDIEKAIPLGLIVTEIISNSLKHGIPDNHQGEIYFIMRVSHFNDYTLEIGDNGVGYTHKFSESFENSIGLKIIRSLTQQLEGEIQKLDKKGTHYLLTL